MTIAGNDPRLTVTEADDQFHPPTSADPTWIETVWFPFWVPEVATSVYARIWFRPNESVQGGAVNAWRDEGTLVAYDGWTEPFTGFADLRDLELANMPGDASGATGFGCINALNVTSTSTCSLRWRMR